MKKLLNYLFPNDWKDIEILDIKRYSSINGSSEGIAYKIIVQKSESTGRYRKQTITIQRM